MPVLATFSNTGEEGAAQRLRLSHESSAGVRGDVIVHCLASGSALLESDRAWVIGEQIDFNFADSAIGIVFWTSGKLAICVFDQAISDATLALEILSGAIGPELITSGYFPELRFHAQAEGSGFAERLYRLRVERGLKQLDIAEKLRVSTAAVSGWESGRSVPRGSRWAELAEYLGVQLAELIGDDSNDLRKLVATSRIDIARLARTTPDKIRISLDL
ncbi:transcriptional regulator with XRE-family HTH domain [Sphingopyxis italica]|uniref:Transcriptional regulator with XRE-family HTH domain n=1 Tax=Sphingopyxis italica TaxID=1129133 RepID=A0A7X6B9I7_9SPHN|nr:helix-turn-helix transcriptional regulator [Sphingopyxis italica]NJB89523.1 transcriptional regulator with XRE-family HTH domain [Sphingopyxis italica]